MPYPIITALKKQRQENLYTTESSLVYIMHILNKLGLHKDNPVADISNNKTQ